MWSYYLFQEETVFLFQFLEHQNPAELTTANFSFSSRPLVGEFLQPTMGLAEAEFVRLGAQEVARRLEELRAVGGFRDARTNNQYERDKLAYAKKLAKEEAQRHKEQARWDIPLFKYVDYCLNQYISKKY